MYLRAASANDRNSRVGYFRFVPQSASWKEHHRSTTALATRFFSGLFIECCLGAQRHRRLIRPSPFSILQIAGQGAGRASRALPRYRLPRRCAAVLPAAREESQGLSRADFPDQDFGGVRELHCNKQSVSQPEFSLTTKLRHSRQNDT